MRKRGFPLEFQKYAIFSQNINILAAASRGFGFEDKQPITLILILSFGSSLHWLSMYVTELAHADATEMQQQLEHAG